MTEACMQAFLSWWGETHDWEFQPKCRDYYETNCYSWFKAGWDAHDKGNGARRHGRERFDGVY